MSASKYKEKYCEEVIAHMAKGYSFASFAGKIDVARSVLYEWEKAHPEFAFAKQLGFSKSLLWWERLAIENCVDGKINTGVWAMNMRNRFGWKDTIPDTPEDERQGANELPEETKKKVEQTIGIVRAFKRRA